MSAIRLLQAERQEEIRHLHRQTLCQAEYCRENYGKKQRNSLSKGEIYDVILAEEQDLREYKKMFVR